MPQIIPDQAVEALNKYTTVGSIANGASYQSIKDAYDAGKYNLMIIGAFTETKNITVGANSLYIKIIESCNMATFNFVANDAGSVEIEGGKLTATYISNTQMFDLSAATDGSLNLKDLEIDLSASTAAEAGIFIGNVVGSSFTKVICDNCSFKLANKAKSGFEKIGYGTRITNINIWGGSNCEDVFVNCDLVLIDNIYVEFALKTGGKFIELSTTGTPSIISNIKNEAGGTPKIILFSGAILLNIEGQFDIDFETNVAIAVRCTNVIVSNFLMNNVGCHQNTFINCESNVSALTIAGNTNKFIGCRFNVAVVLDGDNNFFTNVFTNVVTANGNNNQLIQCENTTFNKVGTGNELITGFDSDVTLAANSDKIAATQKAIKAYIDGLIAAVIKLQGDWNATTNTPDITTTTETGYAWRVSVAGNTDLGGITTWEIGDLAVKTATSWIKIDNEDIAAVWGNISGTLANQTDLQNALDAKRNNALVTVPTAFDAPGSVGQIAYAAGYKYECIATNTWIKQAAITVF